MPTTRFTVPLTQVRWLMGRVHVGTPDAEVVADAERRADKARWNGKPLTPSQKAKLVAAFLAVHRENQRLSTAVALGRLG
jgi:hypothetical protein